MGTASLIIGIISLVIGFIPVLGAIAFLPAIAGLILGIVDIAKKNKTNEKKGQAIAGLVLSAIAILIITFWLLIAANIDSTNTQSNTIQKSTKIETKNDTSKEKVQQEQNKKLAQEQVEKQEKVEKQDYTEVDYQILYQEYQDNAIAADAKYKGKKLQVTGSVYDIDREIMGNPYITFNIGGKYSFKDVRLTFKKSEESKVAKLSKGQTVTIRGICQGTLLSTTVSLTDCEIIQ